MVSDLPERTVKVLPLLTVSVPLLVKLPVVVKLALPARVRLLVFVARLASALVEPDSMVPPSSVSVEELVVMLIPLPTFRFPPRTKVPPESVVPLICARVPVPPSVKKLPGLMVSVPVLELTPPWSDYPGESLEADTQRMNAFIEEQVLPMPEQYFWSHKRFKTRPPGEKGVY